MVVILHFGFLPQETKQNPEEPSLPSPNLKILAFWMEVNITLEFLAFYILLF